LVVGSMCGGPTGRPDASYRVVVGGVALGAVRTGRCGAVSSTSSTGTGVMLTDAGGVLGCSG
jgi:hypothetical protein